MDRITKEQRSTVMSRIRSKNTAPEIKIRKILWKRDFHYRIHDKSIPGVPDISNKSKKLAIFLDGCFWHGCPRCYSQPKSNVQYWKNKILYNKKRRMIIKKDLKKLGWNIVEAWECEIRQNPNRVVDKIFNVIT